MVLHFNLRNFRRQPTIYQKVRDTRVNAGVIRLQNGLNLSVGGTQGRTSRWGQAFSLPPAFQPALFRPVVVARRRAEARRQAESLTPQARQRSHFYATAMRLSL